MDNEPNAWLANVMALDTAVDENAQAFFRRVMETVEAKLRVLPAGRLLAMSSPFMDGETFSVALLEIGSDDELPLVVPDVDTAAFVSWTVYAPLPQLRFLYTDLRGGVAPRKVVSPKIWVGVDENEPAVGPQWLVTAFDCEAGEVRHFALKGCSDFTMGVYNG